MALNRVHCATCRELMLAYNDSASRLRPLAERLREAAAGYEWDMFQRAWNRIEKAKTECENARRTLHQHMATHSHA